MEPADSDGLVDGWSVTGSPWSGRPDDYHFASFLDLGYFDWRVLACVAAVTPVGGTIVEVGANVGTETVALADLVGGSGTVHAVEPFSTNADLLEENVRRHRRDDIIVHRVAVSDVAGQQRFRRPTPRMSGVGHLVDAASSHGPGDEEIVAVSTLDDLFADLDRVDTVVSDTEGGEVRLLSGGSRILERWRPALVLEAADRWLERSGTSVGSLHDVVAASGYEVFVLGRTRLRPVRAVDLRPGATAANWLCLPLPLGSAARRRLQVGYLAAGWLPVGWRRHPLAGPPRRQRAGPEGERRA